MTNIDFCSIQEHFKKNKGSFFKDNFNNFDTSFTPAYREKERDSGRAKGGLAQLSSTKYKVKTVKIPTKNFRLQAQILHFPNTVLLWINSYLPTDPLTVRFNDEELAELQKAKNFAGTGFEPEKFCGKSAYEICNEST